MLSIDREEIHLHPDALAIDRDDVIALARAGDLDRLEAALSRWRGGVLTDLDGLGESWDDWLGAARAITESAVVDAALSAAETKLSPHSARLCGLIATRILSIDPFSERAARLSLRSAAAADETADMHRRYRQFETRLRDELGAPMSEATRDLLSDLARPPTSAAAHLPAPPRQMEAAESSETAARKPSSPRPVLRIARATMAPLFAAAVVLAASWVGLRQTLFAPPPRGPVAVTGAALDQGTRALYQQARTALDTRSRLGVVQGLSMLQQVVVRTPDYSRGWSTLAFAQFLEGDNIHVMEDFGRPTSYWMERAHASAQQALLLDPHNGEADMVLAQLTSGPDDDAKRLAIIERGLKDDPQEPSLLRLHAQAMLGWGYSGRAISDLTRAARLDPADSRTISLLYSSLALAGRIDEARHVLGDGLARFPLYPHLWREKFVALLAGHRYPAAEAMAASTAVRPDRTFIGDAADLVLLARTLGSGRRGETDDPIRSAPRGGTAPQGLALKVWRLALLGRIDEAYEAANADPDKAGRDLEMYTDAPFAAFRRDPRFLPFIADQAAFDQWRTSGRWPDFCYQPGFPYDCQSVHARSDRRGDIAKRS